MEEFEDLSKEKSDEGHGMQVVKINKDVQKLAVELLAARLESLLACSFVSCLNLYSFTF